MQKATRLAGLDVEAYKKMLMSHVLNGTAVFLRPGDRMTVTDVSAFSGMVKVRKQGEYNEVWIPNALLRKS